MHYVRKFTLVTETVEQKTHRNHINLENYLNIIFIVMAGKL